MKKNTLKILLVFAVFMVALCISKSAYANSINSINMDIYVDKNGNAQITETWECSASEHTEWYHTYSNIGNSVVSNLSVTMDGRSFTSLNNWNTSGSLSSKANKCGINKISKGYEVCWGITSYGKHTYVAKYNISNFVSQLTDCQMMYWNLIDFETSIGKVDIKIHTDSYINDSIDVWGFGNLDGLCYVSNGAIYMSSDDRLRSDEYMVLLAKFPTETFNATNYLDHSFSYYQELAEEGSTKSSKASISTNTFKLIDFIFAIVGFMFQILPIILIIFGVTKVTNSKSLKFGPEGKKIPKDVPYYRDIPCNGNIYKAYYIAYEYGILKSKTDILGAIILKWLKQGIIRTENREGGMVFKKEQTVIILTERGDRKLDNFKEEELFDMMYRASKDGILENKEFEVWCRNSYEKVLNWFEEILEDAREALVAEGLITKQERNGLFKPVRYYATYELKQEALAIAGLKKFLKEYTLIADRGSIEVELFENYLIYAQMLGIAKEVSKEFKELYPDMIEQTNYNSYDNIIYINMCASRGVSSASTARAAAQSYSAGGGGFSSGGGGGGSFGGGRRRLKIKK